MSTIAGKMIARAWVDPAYKRLLLDDARAAQAQYPGTVVSWTFQLVCVEQTDDVHNLIVCTPCSCYPVNVVGPYPTWYADPTYRARAVADRVALLSDLGVSLGSGQVVKTLDADFLRRYMVLPKRPSGTDGFTEAQLADLIDEHNVVGAGPV